jgi:hypothetical protein
VRARRVAVRLLLAGAIGLACAGCAALVPSGAPLENCIHVCRGSKACEYQCRVDAGELDEPATGKGPTAAPEEGELIAPPRAR